MKNEILHRVSTLFVAVGLVALTVTIFHGDFGVIMAFAVAGSWLFYRTKDDFLNTKKPMRVSYQGRVYVRPLNRGVILDWQRQGRLATEIDLFDLIQRALDYNYSETDGWEGNARIVIEMENDG